MKTDQWMKLKVVQTKHLQKQSKCGSTTFYECYANLIKKSKFGKEICFPHKLRTMGGIDFREFPVCQSPEENVQSFDHVYGNLFYEASACPESCIIREYTGKVDYEQAKYDNSTFGLVVRFARPYTMTTYEEYLLYDFNGIVGSVGGTLGLFIRFSFYECVLKITNYFQMLGN